MSSDQDIPDIASNNDIYQVYLLTILHKIQGMVDLQCRLNSKASSTVTAPDKI